MGGGPGRGRGRARRRADVADTRGVQVTSARGGAGRETSAGEVAAGGIAAGGIAAGEVAAGGIAAAGVAEQARRAAAHVFVADIEAPALAADDDRHLRRVLRLRPGETLSITDGAGRWRPCTLAGDGRLEPAGDAVLVAAAAPILTVAMAAAKRDRSEWAVQKLTEIGVDRVVILITERSVVRWDAERTPRHLARLEAVARAAAMQSRRVRLPDVSGPVPFASFVEETAPAGQAAMAEPGGISPSIEHPTLLIGPEGGWSPEELAAGPVAVSLAPTILRTETAAVVGGTILMALRSQNLTLGGVMEAGSA